MKPSVTIVAILFFLPCVLGTPFELSRSMEPKNEFDCELNLTLKLQSPVIKHIEAPLVDCLHIEDSEITEIYEGAFNSMTSLKYLNLKGNNIRSVLNSLGNQSTLRTLILSDQLYYNVIDEIITGMYPELQYLDYSRNGISDMIIKSENTFPKLRYLDLSMNRIKGARFIDTKLGSLMHLNLNQNNMHYLEIDSLNCLSFLSLDGNDFEHLTHYFSEYPNVKLTNLTNLIYLSIGQNKIEYVSDNVFRDFKKLRYLNMSANSLSMLPRLSLANLMSLKVLLLDSNLFIEVPMIMSKNLTTLSMKYNNLNSLSMDAFYYLPNLEELNLGWNNISYIPERTFLNQKLLKKLYLNDNQLTYLLLGWFQPLQRLQYLDLSRNRITCLENVLTFDMGNLQHLYISGNPIRIITSDTLKVISKNLTIYLLDEPYDIATLN